MKPTLIETYLRSSLEKLKCKLQENQLDELGSSGIPASRPAAPSQLQSTSAPTTPVSAATTPVTWKEIYNINKQLIGNDPNKIKVGAELKMPDGSTYVVKAGDNLSKIAKSFKPTSQAAAAPDEEPQWKPDTGLSAGPQPGPSGKIGEKPWDATIEFNKMYANPPTDANTVKQLQAWLNTRGVAGIKTQVNGIMDNITRDAMQKYKEYLDRAFQYESKVVSDPTIARIIELAKR